MIRPLPGLVQFPAQSVGPMRLVDVAQLGRPKNNAGRSAVGPACVNRLEETCATILGVRHRRAVAVRGRRGLEVHRSTAARATLVHHCRPVTRAVGLPGAAAAAVALVTVAAMAMVPVVAKVATAVAAVMAPAAAAPVAVKSSFGFA